MRSLTTPLWGVVAMLFPLTTNFYYYATEARGYGLVAGFAGLAVLCWLEVSRSRRRRLYLPLLAFSLAAAVASHYYAGLIVLCLGLGELARTMLQRKIDWAVWTAFGFTGLPVLIFLQTIRSASGYSRHFWAVPWWAHAAYFYPNELGLGPVALIGTLAVAMCFWFNRGKRKETGLAGSEANRILNAWQAVAICSLAGLPFITMVVAKVVTHGFSMRYAIAAIVGITVLLACFLYRVTPRSEAALAAILICAGVFAFQVYVYRSKFYGLRGSVAADIRVLSKTGVREIAVSEITVFHRVSFYAPRPLATRLTFVADPESSIKYLGHDTVDRGLLDLNPWFPLKVIPEQTFLEAHREFLVYGSVGEWNWLTFDLAKWGDIKLLERNGERLLLSASNVHVKTDPKLIGEQRAAASRMLYLKTPRSGPSLCDLYMGQNHCL